jgi:hypothetical protein
MLITEMRHRLQYLGWRTLGRGQQIDGRWWVFAGSCGHTIIAIADTPHEVWSAACAMAMKLTRNGLSDGE